MMQKPMEPEEFMRVNADRAPNLMWFLGAGASAAAGVPTASQMIWDFKRTLYCAAERVSVNACGDLASPEVRARLQQHFDTRGGFPPPGADAEYAAYFEAAHPDEASRRRYLDREIGRASPSFGHYALAALLSAGRAPVVWMTNMDRTVEDAFAELTGKTSPLTVASLDSAAIALAALNERRFPLVGKLHGDYQSTQLKNARQELREQDRQMRDALLESCRRYGLVVVGYSGRDASVMQVLEDAVAAGRAFPQGLFWIHRSGPVPARVAQLIERARAAGVDAHLVEAETFDELLGDLLLLETGLPAKVSAFLEARRPARLSNAPALAGAGGFPVIRLNALAFVEWPNVARLVRCEIGGAKEVRDAIVRTGADVVAGRRYAGVVGFGRDDEMRKAFANEGSVELDLFNIDPQRLSTDTSELALMYDAVLRAFARERPLVIRGRRRLAVDPARKNDAGLVSLQSAIGALVGTVAAAGGATWMEAVELHLELRLGRLWLLMSPTVWVERPDDDTIRAARAEFVRSRTTNRFNREANALLGAWRDVLLDGERESEIRAFGIEDGVDATFRLSPITAFSRRRM
jgi:NAD-dependent SIR2 family protein deacetylase